MFRINIAIVDANRARLRSFFLRLSTRLFLGGVDILVVDARLIKRRVVLAQSLFLCCKKA